MTLPLALILARTFPVFPCDERKRPRCKGGFRAASQDPDAIRALWRCSPRSLIGVPTGPRSGFDVLDIDPRHGGDKWLAKNEAGLPETRVHQTRSGGLHFLFRHQLGLRNSESKIAIGIDTRAEGGYVIFWPAAGYPILSRAPISDWPGWLVAELLPKPEVLVARCASHLPIASGTIAFRIISRALVTVQTAMPGNRHYRLRSAACAIGGLLEAAGINRGEAVQLLLDAVQRAGGADVDINNARATILSGLDWGERFPLRVRGR